MNSTQKTKLTILGSGTSTGIPIVGCQCEVCLSNNPKNKRHRTSFYLETESGQKIVIDTTPDLRTQLLRENINNVDAAFITHDHADHLHGIDDLRPLTFAPHGKTIPVYTHEEAGKAVHDRFPYIFKDGFFNKNKPILGGGIPNLKLFEVPTNGSEFKIGNDSFRFFLLPHGHTKTLGIVYNKLGIFIDCHTIPTPIVEELRKIKLDLLIIDCVNKGEHKTHLTTKTSFPLIKRIAPKRAGLIHMGHDLDHDELEKLCRESFDFDVFPTYDTQQLTL